MRFTVALLPLTALACSRAEADKKPAEYAVRREMCQLALQNVPRLSTCGVKDAGPAFAVSISRRRDEPPAHVPLLERANASFCIEEVLVKHEVAREQGCDPKFDRADLAELRKYLDAWYAERTQPRATGDAAADKYLADLAAVRDRTCACKPKDEACLRDAERALDALPVYTAASRNTETRMALLSELSRCGRGRSLGLYTR